MLEVTTQTVHSVDYSDLEQLIKQHVAGLPNNWRIFDAAYDVRNDSTKCYEIDGYDYGEEVGEMALPSLLSLLEKQGLLPPEVVAAGCLTVRFSW
jgi:hypothetical protein